MARHADFQPSLRFKQTLALSPDGQTVAYVDDGPGQFNVTVQPTDGGSPRQLTHYSDSVVTSVAWHPDGRSLVYTADAGGGEKSQVYQVDLAGGEPRALTASPTAQFALTFGSPFTSDGRRLLYAGNDRMPDEGDLLIRDMGSGEVRRLTIQGAGGAVAGGAWSPDGRYVTAVDLRASRADHVIYLVSTNDGAATRLTPDDVGPAYWPGPWLPDGSGFLVLSNAGRDVTGLARMDTTGRLSWLATPEWDVEDVTLSGDGRVMLWLLNVDGASQLRARDMLTGQDLPVPELPMAHCAGMAVSHDGRTVVLLLSTPTRPWNIATMHLPDGELRWLTAAEPVGADPARMVEPTLVRYPSRNGRHIPALLYRPAGAGPMPVVLAIHGGPNKQERPGYSGDGLFQYFVSQGVAVLAPNVRGSTGYGLAYQRRVMRDWGGADLEDWADAARWLQSQSWVDPKKIGLTGRSYGGFAVLSCVSRLPEFDWAAAVAWCGPSNLVTLARATPPQYRGVVTAMIGDPDSEVDFLLSRSPVTYADQIRTPLLVIQGANDARVPKGESDQIVGRLRARGVEVRYDVYPDEGHQFGKHENFAKAQASAAEFLLSHLIG